MTSKGKTKTAFTYDIDASITGDEDFFTIDPDSGQIRVGEVAFPDPIPAEVTPTTANVTEPSGWSTQRSTTEGDNTFSLIVTADGQGRQQPQDYNRSEHLSRQT